MQNINIRFLRMPNRFTSILSKLLFSIGVSNIEQKLRDIGHLPWKLLVKFHEVMVNVTSHVFPGHTNTNKHNTITFDPRRDDALSSTDLTKSVIDQSLMDRIGNLDKQCKSMTFKTRTESGTNLTGGENDPLTYHTHQI